MFPCHKLHFSGDECPTNSDGVSVCAAAIPVDAVVSAVDAALAKVPEHERFWENYQTRPVLVPSLPENVYDQTNPEPAPIAAD